MTTNMKADRQNEDFATISQVNKLPIFVAGVRDWKMSSISTTAGIKGEFMETAKVAAMSRLSPSSSTSLSPSSSASLSSSPPVTLPASSSFPSRVSPTASSSASSRSLTNQWTLINRRRKTTTHYGTKPGHFETSKIHFPTSEGVSEVSERANK